ncbi:MAG TPA: hypothetical protein VKS82_09515 [Streptosporangiaceae bacterium]|nr:hypothetical protein [Streptosporangiaceae bacterium]
MTEKQVVVEEESSVVADVPGAGPTMTVSTSLHKGTVEAVRRRVGKRGFSSYVEAALRRQIEQDNLAELIDEYTRAEGDFTQKELATARAELYGSEEQGAGRVA